MDFKEWKTVELGEISKDIAYGYTESASDKPIGPKFLRITDIVGGLNWDTVPYCKITDNNLKKYQLEIGDIVIARTGATTGTTEIIKEKQKAVFASYLIRYKIDEEKANPFYVGYILKSSIWKSFVASIIGGSAQPGANAKQFASFEFLLPPIATQTRIASILTSIDDKIELNRQTNATLEALAQTLFKEMCLPKNGEDTEGDKIGKLGEIYKTTSGGTPSRAKSEYYENGTINWVKSKELGNFFVIDTEEKITDLALKNSSTKLLPINTILLAMYGATVGEISILGNIATCNQAICGILPNKDYPYSFVYEFLKDKRNELKSMAVGAAQQNISQVVIQGIEMYIPNKDILFEFHNNVEPLYQRVKNNIEETQTLTTLRDSLLPKLMKGEIAV